MLYLLIVTIIFNTLLYYDPPTPFIPNGLHFLTFCLFRESRKLKKKKKINAISWIVTFLT